MNIPAVCNFLNGITSMFKTKRIIDHSNLFDNNNEDNVYGDKDIR